jgi:hypothetical protein
MTVVFAVAILYSDPYWQCHLDPQEPQIVGGMKTTDPQFGVENPSHAGKLGDPQFMAARKQRSPDTQAL